MKRRLAALPTTLAAALMLGLAGAGGAALAQQATQPLEPQIESADISDAKLSAFLDANERVRVLLEEYRPKLESAETDAKRGALIEALNRYVADALEATPGISLEEYVQIARAARSDEALTDRLETMMQQS